MKNIGLLCACLVIQLLSNTIGIEAVCSGPSPNLFIESLNQAAGCRQVFGNVNSYLRNFVSYNSKYYVADIGFNRIVILDINWKLMTTVSFSGPYFITVAGDYFYISSINGLVKTDTNFNIIKTYVKTGFTDCYRSSWYDTTNNTILAACISANSVDYFSLDLTYTTSLNLSGPVHGITTFQTKTFVAMANGFGIYVYTPGVTTPSHIVSYCNSGDYAAQISIDSSGIIAAPCLGSNKIDLVNQSGGLVLNSTLTQGLEAGYDLNGQLVLVTRRRVLVC